MNPGDGRAAPVIAVDGPGGVGKGTLCHALARELGWHFLDSGALYRLTALAALRHGVAPEDEPRVAALARVLDVRFGEDAGGGPRVLLEGEDVTGAIRSETAGNAASRVAALAAGREALLQRQPTAGTWVRWCSPTRRSRSSSPPAPRSAPGVAISS